MPNARLRGWQRITPNSNTTTIATTAHWDWKRHALTVPLRRLLAACQRLNCVIKNHDILKQRTKDFFQDFMLWMRQVILPAFLI
ncbi:hypothetical protein FLL80_18575 [Vibrio cholerae]|nr:hypothetical protein FLL80_18575 [Vibrio cholerae]